MSRKISLNLRDKEVVDNLNVMCEERGITISDFVREAIQEKYDRETNLMEIFIIDSKKIKKFTIDTTRYNISITDPTHDMKINADAKNEGEITIPNVCGNLTEIKATRYEFKSDDAFYKKLEEEKKIYFFTKKKYKNRTISNEMIIGTET